MAIDSLAKRNSVLSVTTTLLPIPDSTIDQADRQTVLRVYGGILAGSVVVIFTKLTRPVRRTIERTIKRLIQKDV